MRFSDSSERLQTVNCSMAMMLKAVGMTQLAEPVTQGQPYLSGSNRTLRSEVLNFHRQNQCPSRPRSAYSHRKAALSAETGRPRYCLPAFQVRAQAQLSTWLRGSLARSRNTPTRPTSFVET